MTRVVGRSEDKSWLECLGPQSETQVESRVNISIRGTILGCDISGVNANLFVDLLLPPEPIVKMD